MLARGIIVVASTPSSSGPRLDATRAGALQRVANRPIVCHVLDALIAAGVSEIAVLVPEDLAVETATCLAGALPARAAVRYLTYGGNSEPRAALQAVTEFAGRAPSIVHRADGLLEQPLAPFLDLLLEDSPDGVLLLAQGARTAERLGKATQRMLRVADLYPGKTALAAAGVCVLAAGTLGELAAAGQLPAGLEPGAIAERLVAREGSHMQVRVVQGWRGFTGDPLDLLDLNRVVLDSLEASTPLREGENNRFEGRIVIDPTALVSSSVICGPAIIGPGAHVADSYIGPHTSIGARAHVEGVEIERSIVLAGASILHVGGRLVASVVGRDARIFRDFSVPRAMRLQVGDGDEVALC